MRATLPRPRGLVAVYSLQMEKHPWPGGGFRGVGPVFGENEPFRGNLADPGQIVAHGPGPGVGERAEIVFVPGIFSASRLYISSKGSPAFAAATTA